MCKIGKFRYGNRQNDCRSKIIRVGIESLKSRSLNRLYFWVFKFCSGKFFFKIKTAFQKKSCFFIFYGLNSWKCKVNTTDCRCCYGIFFTIQVCQIFSYIFWRDKKSFNNNSTVRNGLTYNVVFIDYCSYEW